MLSKRFLMVLVLSSAARIPLFLTTIALAMRASSPTFIVRISGSALMDLKNTKFAPTEGLALQGHGTCSLAAAPPPRRTRLCLRVTRGKRRDFCRSVPTHASDLGMTHKEY